MPDTVMSIFQDAIDAANKGIMNWLFKHKSVKLLSLLSVPYVLPADVFVATVNKLVCVFYFFGRYVFAKDILFYIFLILFSDSL